MDFTDLLEELRSCSKAEQAEVPEDEPPEEEQDNSVTVEDFQRRRRASLLDNRKNRYVIDTVNNILHDRECELVKAIPDHAFEMCSELKDTIHLCGRCKATAYIRLAIGDDGKRIQIYRHYFMRVNAGERLLRELTVENHAKLYLVEPEVMRIKVREDSWLVRRLADGKVSLFHNNYIILQDGTRFFSSGYHNQTIGSDNTFYNALHIIYDYSWEQHLKAKAEKERLEAAANQPQEDTQPEEAVVQQEVKFPKNRIQLFWQRLVEWFKRRST